MATLGRTDLDVFGLCLGGNVFGWTADEAESFAILDAYTAAGGNFVDGCLCERELGGLLDAQAFAGAVEVEVAAGQLAEQRLVDQRPPDLRLIAELGAVVAPPDAPVGLGPALGRSRSGSSPTRSGHSAAGRG